MEDNLRTIIEKLKARTDFFSKGLSNDQTIKKVEDLLGLKLSLEHKLFLKELGYVSFSGFEFYGICNDSFDGKSFICSIETTLFQRKHQNLPKELVIFCSFDDGYYGYLDYSDTYEKNEPALVLVQDDGNEFTKLKKISNSLFTYIDEVLKKNKEISI